MNLRSVILALLSRGPNTGYGLSRMLSSEAGHLWSTSLQHIYSELANMQADELVEVEQVESPNKPVNKKVYSLTRLGEQRLKSFLAQPIEGPAVKDDLPSHLFCMELMPPGQIEEQIRTHIGDLEREEQALGEQILRTPRSNTGRLLSLELARDRVRDRALACHRIMSDLIAQRQSPPAAVSA